MHHTQTESPGGRKMEKFTTEQLKAALIELRDTNPGDAWAMTFDEVCRRMGDEAFDAWCESHGW